MQPKVAKLNQSSTLGDNHGDCHVYWSFTLRDSAPRSIAVLLNSTERAQNQEVVPFDKLRLQTIAIGTPSEPYIQATKLVINL